MRQLKPERRSNSHRGTHCPQSVSRSERLRRKNVWVVVFGHFMNVNR